MLTLSRNMEYALDNAKSIHRQQNGSWFLILILILFSVKSWGGLTNKGFSSDDAKWPFYKSLAARTFILEMGQGVSVQCWCPRKVQGDKLREVHKEIFFDLTPNSQYGILTALHASVNNVYLLNHIIYAHTLLTGKVSHFYYYAPKCK